MKRVLPIVSALAIFCFVQVIGINPSYSKDGRGVIITPKRIVFEKRDRIMEVIVANRGSEPAKFRISLVNRAMDENGQLKEAQEPAAGEFFASDVLRFGPRQVLLEPKMTQKIRLMSRLPADAPDGEYRSHLLIQEVPEADMAKAQEETKKSGSGIGINIHAIFGMSLPVILRKGELTAQAKLVEPEIVRTEGETYLKIVVERSGTKSFMGTLSVYSGTERIALLKNVAVYLSTPRRIVQIKIEPEHAQSIAGKSLRVTLGTEAEKEDAPEAEVVFTAQ